MPAINSIYIKVYDQKPVYRPGDELKGEWTADIGETISVKSVSVSFRGATLTRWANSEPKADDNKGYENITTQEKIVFPANNRSGDTVDYPAGKYVYKFSFKIPSGMLPSTYEGKYGAIRYWLSFDIERPILRSHIRRIKVITVLDDIDVNLPAYSVRMKRGSVELPQNSYPRARYFHPHLQLKFVGRKTEKTVAKALGFGNQGAVTLFAQTDRGAYCPGEKVYIKYIAENKSEKDLGRIKTELMQKVKFRASGEEKFKYLCLRSINGEELKKGGKLSSTDNKHSITVPAVPPTTMERASHVIKVQYYVKVVIDIPKLNGGDATVILPITLGTIPQGHKAASEVQGASNIPVIDASSAITYTQCVDGYEDGPKIWEDKLFPRFTYVPWCTYVPDFKPLKKIVSPKNITKQVNSGKSNAPGDSKQSPNKVEGSVIKPAISNQMRAQPTAPPISDNPPTYDEAMKDMESFPVQKPLKENSDSQEYLAGSNESETAGEQDNNTADQSDQHCIIMIIRFADTCLKQFRSTLKQNGAKLTKTGGKIIAVAPQVIVIKGSWPAQTSVAVLSFETYESGSNWFKSFQESNGAPGVDIFDCVMLKGSDEEFQNEKNVFTFSFLRRKGDITSEEFKDVTKKVREIVKPIRFELGGRLICSGAVEQNLSELTLSTDNIIALFQWDSIRQKDDYTSLLKEKYKSILISLAKFYTTETQTIFQTENTSYMVEDTS